jgi:hypothetical protein
MEQGPQLFHVADPRCTVAEVKVGKNPDGKFHFK